MKLQYVLVALMALPMSGCLFMVQKSAVVQSKESYDSSSQARIRLYGPYGDRLIKHHNDRTCAQWRETAGAKLHHRVNNGLPRKIRNITAGIPSTERSVRASNDTGTMFRDSFKEYVVDADKPLTLDASSSIVLDNYSKSCRIAVNFVPESGKNYEAAYVEQNRTCTIKITEITDQLSEKKLALTEPVKKVESCSLPWDKSI